MVVVAAIVGKNYEIFRWRERERERESGLTCGREGCGDRREMGWLQWRKERERNEGEGSTCWG